MQFTNINKPPVCFIENSRFQYGRVPQVHTNELLSHVKDYVPAPITSDGNVYPLGFDSWKSFKDCIEQIFKKILKYDNKALIGIYGSSVQGYRYERKDQNGLWFNEKSDYDIVICSEKLFNYIKYFYPRLITRKTQRTHSMPHKLNDKIVRDLYQHSHNWPRTINIMFYKNMREVLYHCILYLHIEIDDNGNILKTYLVGKDIMNRTKVGDRKGLLNKYADRFSNTLPVC